MERKEAIEIVRSNFPNGRIQLSEALKTLIPELQESEDERIRKAIIKMIKEDSSVYEQDLTPHEMVVWLEKQGKKPTWSEEDEKFYNSALWHIKNSVSNGDMKSGEGDIYHWLKSLKERIKS